MTNLREINFGVNKYCGPSVMSALTGRSTDECAAVISKVSGKQTISAVDVRHLLAAFKLLRFDTIQVEHGRSLYGTLLRLLQIKDGDGFYIVLVPHHVVAVEVSKKSVYLVDNHSKQPLNASASARLMQQVDAVYKVVKKSEPVFIRSEIKALIDDSHIILFHNSIYENPEDNVNVRLGHIIYSDDMMLTQIVKAINEAAEKLAVNGVIKD
jgi:hypothetical protein